MMLMLSGVTTQRFLLTVLYFCSGSDKLWSRWILLSVAGLWQLNIHHQLSACCHTHTHTWTVTQITVINREKQISLCRNRGEVSLSPDCISSLCFPFVLQPAECRHTGMGLLVVIYIQASLDRCAGKMKGYKWMRGFLLDQLAAWGSECVRYFWWKDPSNRQVQTSVGNILKENLNSQTLTVLPVLFDGRWTKSLTYWFLSLRLYKGWLSVELLWHNRPSPLKYFHCQTQLQLCPALTCHVR